MKKKLLCFIYVLLLNSDIFSVSKPYYIGVILEDHSYYHEYVSQDHLYKFLDTFVQDSSIESIFISKGFPYVPESD